MKVNTTQYSPAITALSTHTAGQTRPQAEESAGSEKTRPVDPVLGEAQQNMAAMPDIDMARVEAMKEAISAGKISINLDELTGAMQKYYQR
ncbi:flagellar biosynthesis anti-sigma factor FlgM [Cedecea sp. P7760]|jgi:negative regulator of flagellin synthesis FlgM|uniref:flagellar biosynthesis anti-sigma factor FlgM n=1 Tax=Cedecea sp. P7760 TaxID=2726983 RepID=UPI0015A3AB14|nr:flagellar biosynthesis anti-sigma factor FlgM [Cedecea sp. P7760]NWC65522.1 flagellar biosynthesis anti-sigma factor FlgM [Cedecea sp. P7760]